MTSACVLVYDVCSFVYDDLCVCVCVYVWSVAGILMANARHLCLPRRCHHYSQYYAASSLSYSVTEAMYPLAITCERQNGGLPLYKYLDFNGEEVSSLLQ